MLQIQEANTVVVVGGGTTGVELAAEIKTEFHDKKVELCIHFITLLVMFTLPNLILILSTWV